MPVDTLVTVVSLVVLVLGLASTRLERSPFPPTLLALLSGMLLGPAVLDWVDPTAVGEDPRFMEVAARLTLGIGLVSVALRIPKTFPRIAWRAMLVLVAAGMLLTWAVSTALVHWILGLPLAVSAIIGAIVTPTDPIAATPIVTGPLAEHHLPARLRHGLSFESGANDGLGYLFVFLPFLLLHADDGWSHWLRVTLLWEVGFATGLGLALGYSAGRLLQAAERKNFIGEDWRLVYTAALALLAVGSGRILQCDEILAVFVAGLAFTQVVSGDDRQGEERGQEAVNRFFSIPIFLLIGAAVPWQGWADLGWKGPVLAITLLLLRRPPALLLIRPFVSILHTRGDALFLGWFGPVAVSALYYSALMTQRLHDPAIWNVVSLVICTSVVLHGTTAAPLTRYYGNMHRSDPTRPSARSP